MTYNPYELKVIGFIDPENLPEFKEIYRTLIVEIRIKELLKEGV